MQYKQWSVKLPDHIKSLEFNGFCNREHRERPVAPFNVLENDLCEVETSRVIRPTAAFARRAAWLAVVRKNQKNVQSVEQNTGPQGK